VLESADLQAAAHGAAEWGRRLRELRDEGWQTSSHNDRSGLKPGQYMLEAPPPRKARMHRSTRYLFAPRISGRVRAQVMERNGYTCQMCGIGAGEVTDAGRKARLHVGHVVDRSHGGKDDLSNLRALCSDCNQGAKNLVNPASSRRLLPSSACLGAWPKCWRHGKIGPWIERAQLRSRKGAAMPRNGENRRPCSAQGFHVNILRQSGTGLCPAALEALHGNGRVVILPKGFEE